MYQYKNQTFKTSNFTVKKIIPLSFLTMKW